MSKQVEVPWPKIVYAVGTPDYPNEGVGLYKDGLPRAIEESEDLEIRRYLPEGAIYKHFSDWLLSDEAVRAIYDAMPERLLDLTEDQELPANAAQMTRFAIRQGLQAASIPEVDRG